MLVIPVPIDTVAKLMQFLNARIPILVTLLGTVMLVKPLRPWNALTSILVTAALIETPVKFSAVL